MKQLHVLGFALVLMINTAYAGDQVVGTGRGRPTPRPRPVKVLPPEQVPYVDKMEPKEGVWGGRIQLGGKGLVRIQRVIFSGNKEAPFTFDTSNAEEWRPMYVTIPEGAQNGPLTLTYPGGSLQTKNGFVLYPPSLTEMSPSQAGVGETIRIPGGSLKRITEVLFAGNKNAPFQSTIRHDGYGWHEEALVVTVPEGVQNGPLTLKYLDGGATKSFQTKESFTFLATGECSNPNITKGYKIMLDRLPKGHTLVGECSRHATGYDTDLNSILSSLRDHPEIKKPTIASITPAEGKAGDILTVRGTRLQHVAKVKFGAINTDRDDGYVETPFTIVSDSEMKVTVPAMASSSQSYGKSIEPVAAWIKIAYPNDVLKVMSPSRVTVYQGPWIESVLPQKAEPGAEISLLGGFLSPHLSLTVGGKEIKTFVTASPSHLKFVLPKDVRDNHIHVKTNYGEATVAFVVKLVPRLTAISPEFSYAGEKVSIQGDHFINVKGVKFSDKDAAAIEKVSEKELEVTLPDFPGTHRVTVTTDEGAVSYRTFYVINESRKPAIERVEPTSAEPGMSIQLWGKNLGEKITSIKLKSSSGAMYDPVDSDRIFYGDEKYKRVAVVLPNIPAGTYTVEVSNEYGTATSSQAIAIGEALQPRISSISPQGRRLGAPAVIEGTGLSQVVSVRIGTEAIPFEKVKLDSQLISDKELILPKIRWGMDKGHLNQTVVVSVISRKTASMALLSPKEKVIYNVEGHDEKCFPAVGNACAGFGREATTGSTNPVWGLIAAGCSEEKNGKRKCVVVPGSIKHDNCCLRHPLGKRCGGTFPDGRKAEGAANFENVDSPGDLIDGPNDGNCHQEWDDAAWDVKNRRGWDEEFRSDELADLTPAASPNNRYGGGEVKDSARFCAPDGASISARHGQAWCCSGYGKQYWALSVEDWIICEQKPRGVQALGGRGRIRADASPAPKPEVSQLLRVGLPDARQASAKEKPAVQGVKPTPAGRGRPQAGGIQAASQEALPTPPAPEVQPAPGPEIAMPEPPASVPAPVEEVATSTGQPCNPSIPKYQQPGCVEQAEQEKRSPYDGLPCPEGDGIPGYAKIGCIPN